MTAQLLHDEAHVRRIIREHRKRAYEDALRQMEIGCKGALANFAAAAIAYVNELEREQ